MNEITVIGGGVAGLVAAIVCAEGGAPVRLLEAHETLGGRGRSTEGPYVANFGPHVLYANGTLWGFMRERELLPPAARPPIAGILFRVGGERRRTPPIAFTRAVLRLWRTRQAPDDVSFRAWVAERCGDSVHQGQNGWQPASCGSATARRSSTCRRRRATCAAAGAR